MPEVALPETIKQFIRFAAVQLELAVPPVLDLPKSADAGKAAHCWLIRRGPNLAVLCPRVALVAPRRSRQSRYHISVMELLQNWLGLPLGNRGSLSLFRITPILPQTLSPWQTLLLLSGQCRQAPAPSPARGSSPV